MASKLVSAFRRGVARFQSSYRFRSSKNLGRGTASYISLSAMTACGYLWLKTNDDDHLTQISIRPPSHPFGSLMYFNQQGMAFSYVSSIRSNSLKDYHLEKAQSDVSIDSPTSSNFETGSSNHMGSCPNTDSSCLTRHSIADAAAKVSPAVVNLTVTQGVRGMFLGKAIGSGTIIDPNGIILTNAHVVAEFTGGGIAHKGKVVVTLQDGRSFDGEVINADFHTDIAVVRINTKVPLPAAKLGSSSKLRPGDWVIALGCPLFLQNTVTAGIISCVDRKSSDLGLGGVRREYLQTDCAINEGNSGGPLVNLDGEVIGINTMKVLAADGVSFAIPIDSVVNTVEQFKKHGRVVRPWLGLKMLDLNELIIAQLKERDSSFPDVTQGVLVSQVTPGSPADRAGFHSGDVVISFDGKPVKSIKQIVDTLGDKIGVAFKVTVKRANNTQVELTIVPEEASRNM